MHADVATRQRRRGAQRDVGGGEQREMSSVPMKRPAKNSVSVISRLLAATSSAVPGVLNCV